MRGRLLGVATCVILLAACAGSATVTLHVEITGRITWTPCGTVQCATLSVPRDWNHPRGARLTLALARLPASQKSTGVLFTNPGGPGGSGVAFLRAAQDEFDAQLREHFDLVSWDPRGVGASTPLTCEKNLDSFYAVDHRGVDARDIASNVMAAKDFVAACRQHSAAELPFVSTVDSMRDMEAIRAAMGVEEISYIGFSYGTYLGSLYANRFPKRVRAMVLDGAIDPSLSFVQSTIDQARGFEGELAAFFNWCAHHSNCGFAKGGDPRVAYESLAQAIADEPEPADINHQKRTLGPGEFDIGVVSALYNGKSGFKDLAAALAQTASGDGGKLLQYSDLYTERASDGTYSNATAAMYATSCIDAPGPTTLSQVERDARAAARIAPHFGATTTWLGLPCTYWPVKAQTPPRLRGIGAPPLLVVGTAGDPATPLAWAQSLTHQLQTAHLLTWNGDGHTAYGRGSSCIDRAVDRYLLKVQLPSKTTC